MIQLVRKAQHRFVPVYTQMHNKSEIALFRFAVFDELDGDGIRGLGSPVFLDTQSVSAPSLSTWVS